VLVPGLDVSLYSPDAEQSPEAPTGNHAPGNNSGPGSYKDWLTILRRDDSGHTVHGFDFIGSKYVMSSATQSLRILRSLGQDRRCVVAHCRDHVIGDIRTVGLFDATASKAEGPSQLCAVDILLRCVGQVGGREPHPDSSIIMFCRGVVSARGMSVS
jgi:hypothetical protein